MVENRKTIEKISKTKKKIFEKINKIDHLATLTEKKREKAQITKIRNERGVNPTNFREK